METEGIVVAIKKLILPELEAIKGIQAKMDVKLDAVEKRISDLQVHLVEQSRRIDETNSRIDHLRLELTGKIDELRLELTGKIDELRAELTGRIDETNGRIDHLRTELTGKIDELRAELTGRIDELRVDLTGRIDDVRAELSGRIDELRVELTGRIDETNRRIDQLTFQVGKLAQEVERIKREEAVTGDILTRLRSLETKTA